MHEEMIAGAWQCCFVSAGRGGGFDRVAAEIYTGVAQDLVKPQQIWVEKTCVAIGNLSCRNHPRHLNAGSYP